MKILLTGGGTAGHINPAIAIANYIRQRCPECEILFVGTRGGLEKKLVPKAGYDIRYIEVKGLKRSLSPENFKVLAEYITSIRASKRILREFRPDAVIGTGGYVCAPVVRAASSMKIPTIIHEQNVFPGLAIKMLSRRADVTAISFAETEKMMHAKRFVLTGNPLRPGIFNKCDKEAVRKTFGFDDKPIVLMFGGSLGAQKLDEALEKMLAEGIEGFNLIAATGERYYDGIRKDLTEKGIDISKLGNLALLPYIYNMEEVFGAADLVVSRAGAITVSEITALGKAAVLIPSPNVAHNHQEYNARYLEKNGAAKVIREDELTARRLLETIRSILSGGEKLSQMKKDSAAIGITDACETIYNELMKLV